ncbi:MAG TPA: cytochrome b [Burkholderiaceae bacterium]|nr:cytochrome b [Burkholderiaceae bacterium]
MLRNTATSWGALAKNFHWIMAVLILVQITLGLLAVNWHLSPAKIQLFFWHKSLGVLILALLAVRIAWRLANATPALPADMPGWERSAARLSHALLYALLILLPLTGWLVNSAANIPFRAFWLVPLPAIVEPNKSLAASFARVHLGLVVFFAFVLTVHIAAALRHHFVKRNTVLVRMLPERWTTP